MPAQNIAVRRITPGGIPTTPPAAEPRTDV